MQTYSYRRGLRGTRKKVPKSVTGEVKIIWCEKGASLLSNRKRPEQGSKLLKKEMDEFLTPEIICKHPRYFEMNVDKIVGEIVTALLSLKVEDYGGGHYNSFVEQKRQFYDEDCDILHSSTDSLSELHYVGYPSSEIDYTESVPMEMQKVLMINLVRIPEADVGVQPLRKTRKKELKVLIGQSSPMWLAPLMGLKL